MFYVDVYYFRRSAVVPAPHTTGPFTTKEAAESFVQNLAHQFGNFEGVSRAEIRDFVGEVDTFFEKRRLAAETPETPEKPNEALLTEEEAAGLLSVATNTVRSWRYKGTGPAHIRNGPRIVRYRRQDIEDWMKRRTKI